MSKQIPLGQQSDYPAHYDASLLFPVERQIKRDELGFNGCPFLGEDQWTAFELSWLNLRGKPQVGIAEFRFAATSVCLIESKSFKLYLNSFNQERLSEQELLSRLQRDLSAAAQGEVSIELYSLDEYQQKGLGGLSGICLDDLDIDCNDYQYKAELLQSVSSEQKVNETLYSHLLKSNCLITSQPDWASVWISYQGRGIDHASLLRYLVSFRSHNEFHEQCVERIYTDIQRLCQPDSLTVMARYTRRGGLDINPWRSSHLSQLPVVRLARQ